ncbi:PD-(D/E)XK nuclease family protein [Haloarcula salinisoli]|uniref:PD-(D/E)XK nuclease family protein n=1 Tax=Haloarcula salinisoli TaxID=2487746 RepID=A0A8J8CCZ5_9EURY|nr:PD-(D/E)XK nuclease family protein [Halomicroarcula salinisoli]MBX0305773.1 PD-(D/E)XK nuclease family protein [Halomicroarcula salinisoli]
MNKSSIEHQLADIRRQLSETESLPLPTLEIIGQSQQERYWQSLLVYFLDPDSPHGFGSDVLTAFLEAISSHPNIAFDTPVHDATRVTIQSEVPTGSGPVDLLLALDDEWFLCIELKVASPETGDQTVRYASAPTIGDIVVSEHAGTAEYVYLAPETAQAPSSEEFVDVSWRHVVDQLEDVLHDGQGQYPAKSSAQLADYLDTIKRTLNMTNLDGISTETALYTEHFELIDQLTEAYEADKQRLFQALEEAFFAATDVDPADWTVNNRGTNYINFYKNAWQNLDTGTSIEYEPHVHLKRDQPRIWLRLDIEHGNKQTIREEFRALLSDEELATLEANGWDIVDGTYAYFAKSVPIDFESPNESVQRATQELHQLGTVVEPHIDEVAAAHRHE